MAGRGKKSLTAAHEARLHAARRERMAQVPVGDLFLLDWTERDRRIALYERIGENRIICRVDSAANAVPGHSGQTLENAKFNLHARVVCLPPAEQARRRLLVAHGLATRAIMPWESDDG